MATVEALNTVKSEIFGQLQNDVVPLQQSTMATETLFVQSGEQTKQENFISDGDSATIALTIDPVTSGTAGVSALSLNEKTDNGNNPLPPIATVVGQATMNNNGKNKGKRRRRKTKSKGNGGGGGGGGAGGPPYRKSNWKFQRSHAVLMRSDSDGHPLNQAPCNTNKYLMEEHMPEMRRHRNKDSSYSADTEENLFQSMSEDEEFLTKEFSSVYEDARRERLEGMSRTQLIHEYLQLEANYDRLSKNLQGNQQQSQRWDEDESQSQNAEMCQLETNQNIIGRMEDQIKELTAENLELRRQMVDIRNRRRRSSSGHKYSTQKSNKNGEHNISSSASEDSESDSSSDTSTNSTSTNSTVSTLSSTKSNSNRKSHSCSRSPI